MHYDAEVAGEDYPNVDTGTPVPQLPAAVVAHDHDTTQPCPDCVAVIAADRTE
jgi:hypothetical protein